MDSKLLESYLDNIEEFVNDEDKIVTYKLLSKTLGIHVNTAKQLLHTYFIKNKNQNSPPISATYLLAGKLKDGGFKVTIVNEDDLKKAYSNFVEITSEHIYSVQKGKCIKDIKILSGVGKEIQSSKSYVIKCLKSCIKSKNDQKKPVTPRKEESTKTISKQKFFGKENEAKKIEEPVKKPESPVKKSPDVSSSKKPSPTEKSKKNVNKVTENSKKSKGGIANFFANAAQKSGNSNDAKKIKDESSKKKIESPVKTAETDVIKNKSKINEQENKNKISPKKSPSKSPKKSPKKKKKGSKRKRIQLLSDSEESDSEKDISPFEEDSPETPPSIAAILEDDNEEEEKGKEEQQQPRNKRKKRKIVDKTIMNEDGYLETKKEVVFETDSENEAEEKNDPVKNEGNEKKKSKMEQVVQRKAPASNAMKKQASLLTFFKKN